MLYQQNYYSNFVFLRLRLKSYLVSHLNYNPASDVSIVYVSSVLDSQLLNG